MNRDTPFDALSILQARRGSSGRGAGWPGHLRRARAAAFSREGAIGLLVALAVGGGLLWASHAQADDESAAQRERLRLAVSLAASVIQADLTRNLAAADILDAQLRGAGKLDPLEPLAASLRERFALLGTVAVAPGGVVRQVSPAALAPSLTGLRLQDDEASRWPVAQALRSRQMVVGVASAGTQGTVVNGYQPVYRRTPGDSSAQGSWWGLVMVSVQLPELDNYLRAARLEPGSVMAELDHEDPRSHDRVRLTPAALGDTPAQATAQVQLPGHALTLRVAARPAWLGGPWALLQALSLALLSGAACTAVLQRRRRLATRRMYFASSQILSGWSSEFDTAHAQLDALRRTAGMAVVVAVRLPTAGTYQRPGAVVAQGEQRDWTRLIEACKRGDDMLLHLHANDFLLVAHGLPGRNVAARVRRRLHNQLIEVTTLACGPQALPLFLDSIVFEPVVHEPGAVLAKLLVALHAQDGRRSAELPHIGPLAPRPMPTQPAPLG